MLIIPYQTRFTARSLPVVTLALIVINALVYFVFQAGDRQTTQAAAEYYFSSQLPAIELPRYAAVLEKRSDPQSLRVLRAIRAPARGEAAWTAVAAMQRDREFMSDLRAGAIVPSSDPVHATWREQRQRFDALLKKVFTERYALQPDGSWWGLLTHQFLHGDSMHWFGNMLVLLLAGPFAEAALGRARFLLAYLFAGACAGGLHLLASGQTLVGASGAIAGVIAAYALSFQHAWIRVLVLIVIIPIFFWLPALLFAGFWFLMQVLQGTTSLFLPAQGGGIAWWAHIGGFAFGLVVGWTLQGRARRKITYAG